MTRDDVRACISQPFYEQDPTLPRIWHTLHLLGFPWRSACPVLRRSHRSELIDKDKGSSILARDTRSPVGRKKHWKMPVAPDGTTFLIRQLFYNAPARRKVFKDCRSPRQATSATWSRDWRCRTRRVSFQFHQQRASSRLHTSGNGNLKDVIYHVYGREIACESDSSWNMKNKGFHITGISWRSRSISRGNRNFENYFVRWKIH